MNNDYVPTLGPATERAANAFAAVANMTGRTARAARVLIAGGYFEERLETNYFGRDKFRTRLYDAAGSVVPGFGWSAFHACKSAGILRNVETFRTSVWATRAAFVTTGQTATELSAIELHDRERDYL